MTDIPIIFSAPMVLALLAGRKTMTRRIAWNDFKETKEHDRAKLERAGSVFERRGGTSPGYGSLFAARPSPWQRVKPGDRLWVREKWTHDGPDLASCRSSFEDVLGGAGYGPYYFADETAPDTLKWRSPIHMPRWASRLTLIVTATKVEPLQEISEEDAKAEGMPQEFRTVIAHPRGFKDYSIRVSYRGGFVNVWSKLHDEPGHEWEDNPQVVAISFRVILANIDAPEAKAA